MSHATFVKIKQNKTLSLFSFLGDYDSTHRNGTY